MSPTQINIITISPIYVPIELKTGIDRSSPRYKEFQTLLASSFDSIIVTQSDEAVEYESIIKDSMEHRLFTWKNSLLENNVEIHVFPNNVGVAVVSHWFSHAGDSGELEAKSQSEAKILIEGVYADFFQSLESICASPQDDYFCLSEMPEESSVIFWISRTLLLSSKSFHLSGFEILIADWLAYTQRPEDAQDILSGRLDCSMSWLNYVIVDWSIDDERIDCMILAQYYYAAQDRCNKLLKQAIDCAYNNSNSRDAQKLLSRSRVNTRLHQVDFHHHLNYLTRKKRLMLESILASWNYQQLTENGRRMIEICSSKINETESEKRERGSLLTDLILVALSFFTVFELSLYLTELSREMMSRPTLDFNDENPSFMLKLIAEIDTDVMFSSGFLMTLCLVFVYRHIKSR
ncbi:hypothetical protein [Zhongshania sp.]|uniref:hypothetical protein n=1 Tax=Zhongshania sp. TaxID=1971902 RepID=UPI001B7437D4|nr:hypothetical protein [Zhongshania sp.]MBQ0797044.1 hypothetical protein [Zhongshania sp.]